MPSALPRCGYSCSQHGNKVSRTSAQESGARIGRQEDDMPKKKEPRPRTEQNRISTSVINRRMHTAHNIERRCSLKILLTETLRTHIIRTSSCSLYVSFLACISETVPTKVNDEIKLTRNGDSAPCCKSLNIEKLTTSIKNCEFGLIVLVVI